MNALKGDVVAPVTPIEALLLALLAEVRGLRADLAHATSSHGVTRLGVENSYPRETSCLSRADRALLGRLLPTVAGALGSDLFLARDLLEHESAALRLVRRGLNARQIGRLLRRAEGQAVDGYLVERAGLELGAVLWRVVQVPEFPGVENSAVPPRPPRSLP